LSESDNFNLESAKSIVKLQVEGKTFDREICEREPIRTPGAIQSHGALIGVSDDTIKFCSENTREYLGVEAAALLGMNVHDVLPVDLLNSIAKDRDAELLNSINPACFAPELTLKKKCSCWVHHRSGVTFIELESIAAEITDVAAEMRNAERAVMAMRDAPTVEALDKIVLAALRKISGYERVLVYRFDEDWNGETTAEDMLPDSYQPFLGLRFPASDIPKQARALYVENMLRLMADRDAITVKVLQADSVAHADLSGARLRAQSPVHLEYQRNIDVNGAMSVSVMKDGKLWGLIVGHHRQPHRIGVATSTRIVNFVQAYSMRLSDLEDRSARGKRVEQQRTYSALLEQMAVRDDFVDALVTGSVRLTELLGATGAAIVRDGIVHRLGDVPSEIDIIGLIDNLQINSDTGILSTDHSQKWDASLREFSRKAAGILILPLRDESKTRLLWFRRGIAETVVWAGNPEKALSEDGSRALPRRSFERWTEERSGRSEPWSVSDIEIATSLGFAIEEIILRHGRKIKALSQKLFQAERATAAHDVTHIALRAALEEKEAQLIQKDFLLREVDHRVRNSLALISSMLQLQARSTEDPIVREKFADASRRVTTVGHVHQRLYQTGELRTLDFGDYLRALTSELSDSSGPENSKRLILETASATLGADIVIPLGLIVNELVTNAFKHGGEDSPLTVNVAFSHDEREMRLVVQDNGKGLPESFDPKQSRGLGMRLVNGLVKQLNATLRFEHMNPGTRFTVAVPSNVMIGVARH
jgi:chemotaxis family two-component system sensor kinase Cph1